MEEKTKIRKLKMLAVVCGITGWFALLITALCFALGAAIFGGAMFSVMITLLITSLVFRIKIQEYLLNTQTLHFNGQFPLLENYGFVLKGTVYTRIIPRGNSTYTVYINFDKQIYCEKNGKEIPEYNFAISDLIRDGLVTVEREVL